MTENELKFLVIKVCMKCSIRKGDMIGVKHSDDFIFPKKGRIWNDYNYKIQNEEGAKMDNQRDRL